MGRKPGFTHSEETLKKMRKTKAKNKKKNIKNENGYPIIYLTGKEKNGFDFWGPLRCAYRPTIHNALGKKIEVEIVQPAIWQNTEAIIAILRKYSEVRFIDKE